MCSLIKVAIGILLSGQDIKKATDKIRLHTQLYPNTIELERGLNQVLDLIN